MVVRIDTNKVDTVEDTRVEGVTVAAISKADTITMAETIRGAAISRTAEGIKTTVVAEALTVAVGEAMAEVRATGVSVATATAVTSLPGINSEYFRLETVTGHHQTQTKDFSFRHQQTNKKYSDYFLCKSSFGSYTYHVQFDHLVKNDF